jgi:hypothetical protein
MSQIEWRIIADFPNYEVSNDGRVRSVERWRGCGPGNKSIKHFPQVEIKQYFDKSGYKNVSLYGQTPGHVRRRPVHRLVAQTFNANPGRLPEIHHTNDNKTDNRAENLEWISHDDHVRISRISGVYASKGTDHPMVELTELLVLEIREASGSHGRIAANYGISRGHVTNIKARRAWRHV